MDESEYWFRLEYRVCHELDGLRHTVARPYWCDGLLPTRYILSGHSPCIVGQAWMGIGSRQQEEWQFALLLGRTFSSQEEIDWSSLLPPPDATRWLTVEPDHKHLTIEPSDAVPDA